MNIILKSVLLPLNKVHFLFLLWLFFI